MTGFVNRCRAGVIALTAWITTACAAGIGVPRAPSPAEIPALEQRIAADPADAPSALLLAQAYRAAGRPADARPLLERTVQRTPGDPAAAFLLGVTYEELQLYSEARALYRTTIDAGAGPALRAELEGRLPLLQRLELRAAAQQAVRREAELSATPPEPRTIAVLPFDFVGRDPQLRPLGRALAEMLVTDLSQTDRVRVLERAFVQALLDEMQLTAAGAVDPATAARAGRVLRAERVVNGSMDDAQSEFQLETAIVRVSSIAWPGEAPPDPTRTDLLRIAESDQLSALFALQKRLALRIYSSLGVTLTAAERERVTRNATENLMAFLAFGLGLEAEDRGDFATAARQFSESARLDPGFTQAREAATRATSTAAASAVTTRQLSTRAEGTPAATTAAIDGAPDPLARDAAAEILRTEGLGAGTVIEIIIRQPGGER